MNPEISEKQIHSLNSIIVVQLKTLRGNVYPKSS